MNFENFSPHLLRFAIEKELQLNSDTKIAAMIALTRLKKDPEYYHKKHGYIEMQKARTHKYIKRIPNGKGGAIDMKRNIVKIYDNLYFRLQKARTHKYIKRIPKPSGKGFLYFYTQQQVKDFKEKGIVPREEKTSGLFSGILSFFGLKDERQAKEKVQAEYSKHKETLSGISEVDFSSHLNEYLTNKKMWDAKIAGKKKAPTKSVNKKTGKVVKKGGGGEKKSGFKLSVMKTIAGIYGGSEETKSAKSAVMSDEAEKDFSAEIKNIIGKGYWNGTIYGGKRGYSVYVDNKKVEITKEEKEKIENLQKNIEEGIDDNNQTVIAKKLKEDAIKDIKSFVQLNVGEPFNPEIKELNKNLTRDSSIEKVLENVLHKLKQINDPTFWIENKDKQAMDFPDLLIDTGHLSENFQEVPLAEQTKEHVKGSREELYKKSYLTEKITQSAKGPDFIPTKDEIGQKEASIDLMSSSTIDDNTKINFIVDKQTKRPLVAEWIDKELEIEGKILSKNNMDLAFDNFKEWMNPSKKEETKSAKSAVMSEEEYLESKGASKGKTGEAALHKNRGGMSDKQWSKMVDSQAEKDRKILEKRDELRKEYKEKVEKGEIKPPTRIESLIRTAQGHEDNEATKAAQKLLKKRGIDWEKPNEKRDIMSEKEEELNDKVQKKETKEIPEQFRDKIPFETKLIIRSKGKKYFKVTKPNSTFKMDLYINESSKNFKGGDEIKLNVLKHEDKNKYGTKVQYYPISDDNVVETQEKVKIIKDKKELDKWMNYVRQAAEKGYIYTKGVEKLQTLGIEKIKSLNNELKDIEETIQNKKTIQKINNYLGYMQEAADKGYVYKNGLNTLKELKIENYPEKQEKLNKILDQVENKKQGHGFHVFTHEQGPRLNSPTKSGDDIIVYKNTGKTFRIDSDDEFTFGFNPGGGEAARYYYRDATEEEIKQYNENQEKKRKEKELKNNFNKVKNKVETLILTEGEYIQEKEQISLKGTKYFDTINIYGGGSYILIDDNKKHIWFIQNNGMDGDNWSRNNIKTGGAGAIGKRLRYEGEMKETFKKLLEANEIINGSKLEKAFHLLLSELKKAKSASVAGKPMNKAYIKIKDNLYLDLSKAKAVPVGTISKDGKTKKAAEGKWVPVGKDKPKKTDDKSPDNKSPELDEKNKETIKNVLKRVASILAEALSGKDTVSPTGTTIEEAGESATAKKKKIPTGKDTKKE